MATSVDRGLKKLESSSIVDGGGLSFATVMVLAGRRGDEICILFGSGIGGGCSGGCGGGGGGSGSVILGISDIWALGGGRSNSRSGGSI